MEQVASVTTPDLMGSGLTACLRLRQGASSRATWILDEAPGGTMISVGADPTCDWQIRAAFVPPRAFSILLVGGTVFVRSGPEPGVLLNGKPLEDGWTPIPSGGRIDCGLARLEVTTGHAATPPELLGAFRGLEGVAPAATPPHAQPVPHAPHATRPNTSPPSRGGASTSRAPGAQRSTSSQRTAPRLDATRELEHFSYAEPSEAEVVPALLEEEKPSGRSGLWRYALLGVATAGAYGGWVALLDHF